MTAVLPVIDAETVAELTLQCQAYIKSSSRPRCPDDAGWALTYQCPCYQLVFLTCGVHKDRAMTVERDHGARFCRRCRNEAPLVKVEWL